MGTIQSQVDTERIRVVSFKDQVLRRGNSIVSVINKDQIFDDDFCTNLQVIGIKSLEGFRNQDLAGIATLIGIRPDEGADLEISKAKLCGDITEFFVHKINLVNRASRDAGFCERIEEDIYRNVENIEVCGVENLPDSRTCSKGFKCCGTGKWICMDENSTCDSGFETSAEQKKVGTDIRSYNREIVRRYKDIDRALQDVLNAETVKDLDKAEKRLNVALRKQKTSCLNVSSDLLKYKSEGFDLKAKPEGYIKDRFKIAKRNVSITDDNALPYEKGNIVEMITPADNNGTFIAKMGTNTGSANIKDFR